MFIYEEEYEHLKVTDTAKVICDLWGRSCSKKTIWINFSHSTGPSPNPHLLKKNEVLTVHFFWYPTADTSDTFHDIKNTYPEYYEQLALILTRQLL